MNINQFNQWLATIVTYDDFCDSLNPTSTKIDPDTYLVKLRTPDAIKRWLNSEQDYLVDYLPTYLQATGHSPKAVSDQVKKMGRVIELIPDDTLRNVYFDAVGKTWGAFKKNYKLTKREVVDLPKLEKLKGDDKSAFFDFGYWEKDGAYWTYERNKEFRICNFTIQILFFVRSENEPKYVCLFTNMFGRHRTAAITTDDFTTVGTFRKIIGRLGNFIFEGNDQHLNKIKMKLFFGVREAEEPQYMGYNQYGNFYTWANGIWNINTGSFYPTDKYGIVELNIPIGSIDKFKALAPESHVIMNGELYVIETPEKFLEANSEETIMAYINNGKAFSLAFYFLPFSTRLKVTAHDDDDFEFERKFKYTLPGETNITIDVWSKLMVSVYKHNGMVAVGYYVMSVFRDIVYKANNNYIPILGFFGMRGSGKSTCARSLNRMFGDGLEDGVNLESGSTATGIRRYMASMQNAILWLNEYKNSLPDYTLGMIKGISDGSGKLTGRNTGGNETKTYKPRCTVVLCGQDFPTKDPAILSRTIICEFDSKDRNRQLLDQLVEFENKGYGSQITCSLLSIRSRVKELYGKLEPIVTKILRQKSVSIGEVDDRLLLNISSILTVMVIATNPTLESETEGVEQSILALINAEPETYEIDFGFSINELLEALLQSLEIQVDIQHTSDDVEQYFQVIMTLVERKQVTEGHHYKLVKNSDSSISLFLRVNQIHGLYRAQAEQAGYVAMDIGTLRSYLAKHKSFVRYHDKNVKFEYDTNRTSAYELNYDWLKQCGIELRSSHDVDKMATSVKLTDQDIPLDSVLD